MKTTKLVIIGSLFLLVSVGAARAQSLADYAREAKKNKTETSSASHHYDNDNLPTNGDLSVVGPPPATDIKKDAAPEDAKTATAPKAPAVDPAATAAEHQKAADELAKNIQKQKEKIDWLSHDLDLEQREYRLRAAAFYGDAGDRLRNAGKWDKDDAQFKSDIASKQQAVDAARQELDALQEQARKAGVQEKVQEKEQGKQKDTDAGTDANKDNNTSKNTIPNDDKNENKEKDK